MDEDLYRERCPNVGEIMCSQLRKSCTKKSIKKRFPVVEWLPKYNLKFLFNDFVAGLTVGLTAIPQGIAYGELLL